MLNVFYKPDALSFTQSHSAWVTKIPPWSFLAFFSKQLGIFCPNSTHLLRIPIYAPLQIFILPATLTKLCHIKYGIPRSHHMRKMSTVGQNARWHFLTFFLNRWKFSVQILHVYYAFPSTLDYNFLFNYLQLWQSYAILIATTQRAFLPMVDILSIRVWCELGVCA